MLFGMDWALAIYVLAVVFIIGLVMGSFLNCAAMRIARGESFVKGRSHCMKCGHQLGILDLFPLFSWLFLGGKCRYCKEKISARYPVTELIMGLMSVACVVLEDFTWLTLRNWLFICLLFLVSLVDLEIQEIPNWCVIAMAGIWGATVALMDAPISELTGGLIAGAAFGIGILLLALLMDKLLKKNTLGGGDIKLIAACGLYLGVMKSLFMLVIACIVGLGMSIVLKKDSEMHFAFGPAIAIATAFMLLAGGPLVSWYMGLF